MPLHCIICDRATPRNFADERIFNGVYCEKCAPKMIPVPPNHARNHGPKPTDPATRWEKNLENLNAGTFGDTREKETLLRYWEAQAAAGYPGASENVQYFKDITAKDGEVQPQAENRPPWRSTIQRLIKTPPAPGVEIWKGPVESLVEELERSRDQYLRQTIAIHCDPDVLEQTARKNAELMETLAEINEKLERGELVKRPTGRWAYHAPIRRGMAPISDLLKCSVCDGVVERLDGVNYHYCPNCGAKMEG